MRQIVLDTETTGLEPSEGHRIIEIGCYELSSRRPTGRTFHHYLHPGREVDEGALEIHGISNELLADKPPFEAVAPAFVEFIRGAELIIHNAPFDIGFLNYELSRLDGDWGRVEDYAGVTDSLVMAREMHPGQRNGLDALCKRYAIDNTERELHGALLDAEILADVYLAMTGGQTTLSLDAARGGEEAGSAGIRRLDAEREPLPVVTAGDDESAAHADWLAMLDDAVGGACIWRQLETDDG